MASIVLDCSTSSGSCFFFGFIGVAASIVFSNLGAAYGTAKSGVGISSMGVMNPQLVMRNIVPVIMAGILGIYGLIISIILVGNISSSGYTEYRGYAHLSSGLSVGLSALAAGMSIGIAGDAGVRANGQQPRLFVAMILMLIFAEAIGLYGLIVAIVLSQV
jgi:V-type H+-transporting ATPase proteolipid subunit